MEVVLSLISLTFFIITAFAFKLGGRSKETNIINIRYTVDRYTVIQVQ